MSFDFINLPTIFKYLIKNIFYKFFDDFIMYYFDNIIFFLTLYKNINNFLSRLIKIIRQ